MKRLAKTLRSFTSIAALTVGLGLITSQARAHGDHAAHGDKITATGEVVDIMCYLDHEAKGTQHADCARTCIVSGGPVGLLTADGTLYLLIGDHAPANQKLAPHAAKTITVTGKLAERAGMKMIENIRIKS